MTQFPIEASLRVFHLDCLRVGLLAGLQRSGDLFSTVLPTIPDEGERVQVVDVYRDNAEACVALMNKMGRGENPAVVSLLHGVLPDLFPHLPKLLSEIPVSPSVGMNDPSLYEVDFFEQASLITGALWLGLPPAIPMGMLDRVNWRYFLKVNGTKPVEERIPAFLNDVRRLETFHAKRGEQLGSFEDAWMENFLRDLFCDTFFTHKSMDFRVGSSCEPASGDFEGRFVTQYPWRRFDWSFHWNACDIRQTYGPPVTSNFFERLKAQPAPLVTRSAPNLMDLCAQNGVKISVVSSTGQLVFEYDGRPEDER